MIPAGGAFRYTSTMNDDEVVLPSASGQAIYTCHFCRNLAAPSAEVHDVDVDCITPSEAIPCSVRDE